MSWRTMNVGVPIEDMQMLFDLELVPTQKYYKLNGIDLSANLLDGTVNSKAFDYELTSQKGGFDLMIEEFALNRILALEEEDFESTGRISGSVPVHIEDGKLQVSDGVIFAIKPGGIIRYNASRSVLDMIEKNESLKVVIDAMSNFQYESLEADLQYSPEGILLAETRLVGNNPDYENGREIQLNLSLEENVGTLLKSLMFSEETSAKIGKKMKNGVRR